MKLKCCIFLMLSLNWHVAHAKPAAETALILTVGPNAALVQSQPKLPADPQQPISDSPWQQRPADVWKTLFSDNTTTTSRQPDSVSRWTLPTLIMALLGLLWLISRSQRHG